MSRQTGMLITALAFAMIATTARASATVEQAQAGSEILLKVDVVLTRDRTEASKREDLEVETAARNVERQEALFKKGLINQQGVDNARMDLRRRQAEQEDRTRVEKISRLPYTLLVSPGQRTSLRVGVSVPIGQATKTAQGVATSERQYHPTGVSIDCIAQAAPDGRYRLQLTVEDTSIVPNERVVAAGGQRASEVAFRTLSVSNTLLLREGQTLPFTVGTDRITGETLRAEVSVSILK